VAEALSVRHLGVEKLLRFKREKEFRGEEEGLVSIILVNLKADKIEEVVKKRAIFNPEASVLGFQFLKVFVVDFEEKGSCAR